MRFTCKQQKQTEGLAQIPAMSGDNGKNNGGLITRIQVANHKKIIGGK
jgi:hypothetical protein